MAETERTPQVGDLISRRVAVSPPVEREQLELTTQQAMVEVTRHAAEHGLILGNPTVTVLVEVRAEAVGEEHADGTSTVYERPEVAQPADKPRFCVRCALPERYLSDEPCIAGEHHKLAGDEA